MIRIRTNLPATGFASRKRAPSPEVAFVEKIDRRHFNPGKPNNPPFDAAIIAGVPTREIMKRFNVKNGAVQRRKLDLRLQGKMP